MATDEFTLAGIEDLVKMWGRPSDAQVLELVAEIRSLRRHIRRLEAFVDRFIENEKEERRCPTPHL